MNLASETYIKCYIQKISIKKSYSVEKKMLHFFIWDSDVKAQEKSTNTRIIFAHIIESQNGSGWKKL